ncbi:MAG: histone H1 [Bacteroidetes bacterium]|nr:histone H1 [Bacteroidota bacterium]
MKELIEKINAEYETFSKEAAQQVEKGNKAAGTRARKAALELSKLFKDFRKESVEASKAN